MTNDDLRAVVLFERRDDPDLRGVAAALGRELGVDEADERDAGEPSPSAIALPVADDVPPPVPLERARVAVVLDPASARRARDAGVPRIAVLAPRLAFDWKDELDADVVIVSHEALVEEVVARGVPESRVRTAGIVAPEGWAPAADRAALRAELGARADAPWVVVRAAALDDDPAAALVQLSLVRANVVWLLDVGSDPDLARSLRRRVPAYGLDALMFADGPDAVRSYQAADAVLGRIGGAEAIRAISVGAALVTFPPRSHQHRLAHVLETSGVLDAADAAATLAVTLDRTLEPDVLAKARAAVLALEPAEGARRVAAIVRQLARGELGTGRAATGLPFGLERLSEPDRGRPAKPAGEGPPVPRGRDDLDARVDEELAALRQKLGLT